MGEAGLLGTISRSVTYARALSNCAVSDRIEARLLSIKNVASMSRPLTFTGSMNLIVPKRLDTSRLSTITKPFETRSNKSGTPGVTIQRSSPPPPSNLEMIGARTSTTGALFRSSTGTCAPASW